MLPPTLNIKTRKLSLPAKFDVSKVAQNVIQQQFERSQKENIIIKRKPTPISVDNYIHHNYKITKSLPTSPSDLYRPSSRSSRKDSLNRQSDSPQRSRRSLISPKTKSKRNEMICAQIQGAIENLKNLYSASDIPNDILKTIPNDILNVLF